MSTTERELRLGRGEILGRLLRFLRPLYGVMGFSVLMRILNLLSATALLSLAVGSVFYYVQSSEVLWTRVGYMAGAAAAMGLFHYLEQWSGHYVAFCLLTMMRNEFYDKLVPLAPAGTAKMQSGDTVARVINDVELIEPFYAHTVGPLIAAIIVPGVLLVFLAQIHPSLAYSLLPFLAVMIFVIPLLVDARGRAASTQVRRAFGAVNAHLTDSLQGIRDTLAFGYGERRRKQILELGVDLEKAKLKLVRADAMQRGLMEFAIVGAVIVLLVQCVDLALAGQLNVLQDIPIVVAVTATSFTAVVGLTNVMNDFNTSMVCADRLYELMDQVNPVDDTATTSPEVNDNRVEFDGVRFSYGPRLAAEDGVAVEPKPEDDVLRGLSFAVEAGSHTAVVGASGAGKSTLVNLLLRFWDPRDGAVKVAGHDVREYRLDDLRDLVAVVSQRTYVFNTTIGDNIRMGRVDATDAEVDDAVQRANLKEFIASLPEGYDTPVGEGGSKISGGQRQRIAIARALLKDAPILILDEATSSLDVETEREVNQAIGELMHGRTVLTIAHRLSAVVQADEVLVLEGGVVCERGTHTDLLAKGGVYTRLFELQQDEIRAENA